MEKKENIEIIDDGEKLTDKVAVEFAESIEKAAASVENISDAAGAVSGTLTPDEFEQHFFELFDIVGELWDIPDLPVQRDKPFEVAGAKVSARKLYGMAQKYKMLHFLIEPCGGWFGDIVAIACFAGAKANVVCKKYTGNGLTGYLRRFMKKSSDIVQVKKNSLMSKLFNKGGENEKANNKG